MSAPSDEGDSGGTLYDGVTAFSHRVELDVRGDELILVQQGGWNDRIPLASLKVIDAGRDTVRFGRDDQLGWRLVIPAGSAAWPPLKARIGTGERYGGWIDRVGLWRGVAVAGSVAAAVLALGFFAPAWLAPHVPRQWERNLGDAMVGDFGENRCRAADGQRALEAMVERIDPGATTGDRPIRIATLDIDIFNAAALPGEHIVIFKPAITETEPDALAGIVAHEIAHIRRRHVTQALIRELGIGALIRLFAGDIGGQAGDIMALSYTRAHEREADADAIAMLKRAGISPKPTAELFEELADDEGEGFLVNAEFLQSHPMSRDRAKAFAGSFDPRASYRPVLGRQASDALFNICWTGRTADRPAMSED